MSEQLDWVGDERKPKQPRLIGNQRPTTAEEKATLCLRIGELCNKPPKYLNGSSVNKVRDWMRERDAAMKVAKNSRATVNELSAALRTMERMNAA